MLCVLGACCLLHGVCFAVIDFFLLLFCQLKCRDNINKSRVKIVTKDKLFLPIQFVEIAL